MFNAALHVPKAGCRQQLSCIVAVAWQRLACAGHPQVQRTWPLHRPAAGLMQRLRGTSHEVWLQSASPGEDSQGCLHAGLCRCQLLPVICCSSIHSSVCPVLLHLEKVVL